MDLVHRIRKSIGKKWASRMAPQYYGSGPVDWEGKWEGVDDRDLFDAALQRAERRGRKVIVTYTGIEQERKYLRWVRTWSGDKQLEYWRGKKRWLECLKESTLMAAPKAEGDFYEALALEGIDIDREIERLEKACTKEEQNRNGQSLEPA